MASTQTSNGGGKKKLSFRPTKSTGDTRPDVPADKWSDNVMPRGSFKIQATKTKPDGTGNQPRLQIPIKLGTPDNDENESFKGAVQYASVIFYGDDAGDMTRVANMNKNFLKNVCEAAGVDYDEVYPTSIESEDDLQDLIRALEGKRLPEVWTTHRVSTMENGEEIINIDFRFKAPGAGLAKSRNDEGEEEEAPKKGSKKTSRR